MIGTVSQVELLSEYNSDGFVAVPQFVSGDEFTELLAHVERFIRDVVPQLPAAQVFYEDKNNSATLKQIQQMGDHHVVCRPCRQTTIAGGARKQKTLR